MHIWSSYLHSFNNSSNQSLTFEQLGYTDVNKLLHTEMGTAGKRYIVRLAPQSRLLNNRNQWVEIRHDLDNTYAYANTAQHLST